MAQIEWKAILNPILSIFDKEFRILADKGAKKIPADSFLRTEAAERACDILRGFLEKNVHFKNPIADTAKEKIVDIGDYFASALFGGKKADKKATVKVQDWMNRFLAEAEKRISQAKDEEALDNELKRLKKEFEIRKTIVEIVEAAAKIAEPVVEEPKIEPVNWGVLWEKLKKLAKKIKKRIRKLKIKEKAKKATENFKKIDKKICEKIPEIEDPGFFKGVFGFNLPQFKRRERKGGKDE